MSRNIQNDHPWDESEIAYQLARGRDKEVEQNRKDFPPGSEPAQVERDSVEVQLTQEDFDRIQNMDEVQLKSELKKAGLSTKGDEVELKVRLAQHVQAGYEGNADSSSN